MIAGIRLIVPSMSPSSDVAFLSTKFIGSSRHQSSLRSVHLNLKIKRSGFENELVSNDKATTSPVVDITELAIHQKNMELDASRI